MNSIGERLQYLRKTVLKLNQKDFAQVLEVSQGALSEIERNNRGLPMEAIVHLVKYSKQNISFSCEWLLTGDGEIQPQYNLPPDPRQLEGYQRTAAETCLDNLTMDQAALINCYEKLDATEKDDIWAMIKHKLSRKTGLDSNSLTSKNGLGDDSKSA